MPKVLISDKLSPQAVDIFKDNGVEVDFETGLSPEELVARIGDYDGLAVRSATKVTADVLAAADNLKVVGRAGIGVDNIDLANATKQGVVVMNTPFGNATTTAEHAIAMMFALARQLPAANGSTQAGKWEKSRFMGREIEGKTLGLIGCGNIGSIVADRAQGLRMKVIVHDPYLSPERAADLGIEKLELPDLFARADFISLHAPLTDGTKGIIDAAAIAQMRPGVQIINCARGGLVIEEDLAAALDSGHVAGAAFDVFVEEPARENVLFGRENVVCTPHLGAATTEAQEKVALQVAQQMADVPYFRFFEFFQPQQQYIEQMLNEKQYQEAYELAKSDESFLGQVLSAGLAKLSAGYPQAIEAMQERAEEETMKLEHRLSYMALIGTISPMIGLLGTVQGMVASFQVIAAGGSTPKAVDLAEGSSKALFTTLLGLGIAIPAIVVFNLLKNQIAKLVLEVGIDSESLMNRFENVGPTASKK